ncbi:hypothetical protein LCGC14_2220530 [marine sediment metagenome]|uniref:Ubiquitin-activating enzyme E1 FCCH domain-containing protein n=1 Tax=marine sediment metagenome TaxID=412755 RepID=A0A0F9DB36_9ZZZZ
MADRNLTHFFRGGRFHTDEGMEVEIPPSGFAWREIASFPSRIDIYEESVSQVFPLGTKLTYGEETYRYAQMGAGSVEIAAVCQAVVPLAGHIAETGTVAQAIGDTQMTFTPNTVTTDDLAANELQDGNSFIYDGTGEGHIYKVKSHPAITGGQAGVLTLLDPVRVATGSTAAITATHNKYKSVIIVAAGVQTAVPVGVTVIAVTTLFYFWLQTKGPCCVLVDGTLVMGREVRCSEDDDGAVAAMDYDEANDANAGKIGRVLEIGADATGGASTYGFIELLLE